LCEEIAELARRYLENPHGGGIQEIDHAIEQATAEARWDDVGKWTRVRLRFLRFQQQGFATAPPRDSLAQG
jgi:hypothetical protein